MKRLTLVCSIVFILFILFYDLKIGTIPIQDLLSMKHQQKRLHKNRLIKR